MTSFNDGIEAAELVAKTHFDHYRQKVRDAESFAERSAWGGRELSAKLLMQEIRALKRPEPSEAEIDRVAIQIGEPVTLAECPVGLFLYDQTLALKTEYGDNEGRIDAYIVETGEFFWGGTMSKADQRQLVVRPVAIRAALAAMGRV